MRRHTIRMVVTGWLQMERLMAYRRSLPGDEGSDSENGASELAFEVFTIASIAFLGRVGLNVHAGEQRKVIRRYMGF